jgi:hypothetical protein
MWKGVLCRVQSEPPFTLSMSPFDGISAAPWMGVVLTVRQHTGLPSWSNLWRNSWATRSELSSQMP